jgi:hypothetical protein
MICPSCGWTVHEDQLKPKTELGAKWTGNDMIVQGRQAQETSDLPPGAQIISEEEIPV